MDEIAYRPVKMCVCFNRTFMFLKESGVTSVEDARQRFGCGTNCGTCLPYIQKMIDTGEVEFAVV